MRSEKLFVISCTALLSIFFFFFISLFPLLIVVAHLLIRAEVPANHSEEEREWEKKTKINKEKNSKQH